MRQKIFLSFQNTSLRMSSSDEQSKQERTEGKSIVKVEKIHVELSFEITDEVEEGDAILILSRRELKALMSGYSAGIQNRLRARHRYYKDKPDAKRKSEDYPTRFRLHKDGATVGVML